MNYPQPDSAVRSAALELTLCPVCARYFGSASDVTIRRLDSFQQVKDCVPIAAFALAGITQSSANSPGGITLPINGKNQPCRLEGKYGQASD